MLQVINASPGNLAPVFDKLIEPVGGWNLALCDALMQQGGPMELTRPTTESAATDETASQATDEEVSGEGSTA